MIRRLALLGALAASGLAAAQPASMDRDLADVVRNLQRSGLLPEDLEPYRRTRWDFEASYFGPAGLDTPSEVLGAVAAYTEEQMRPKGGRQYAVDLYIGSQPAEELQSFYDRLAASGALSPRVQERLAREIEAGHHGLTFGIAQQAARLAQMEERLSPEALSDGLDALAASGALPEADRAVLESQLRDGSIEDLAGLVASLPTGVALPAADTADPEAVLRQTLEAITDRLGAAGVANLGLGEVEAERVEREASGDWVGVDLRARAEFGGRMYRARDFFGSTTPGVPADTGAVSRDLVTALVNKALRDAGAAHRVYAVASDPHLTLYEGTPRLAFVALTEAQAEAAVRLGGIPGHRVLRDDTFTTARTDEALGFLDRLGMLDGIEDRADRLGALADAYLTSPKKMLEVLGLTWHHDPEMGDLDTPYTTLLGDLTRLSRGAFAPTDIDERFDLGVEAAPLAFTVGGRRFSATLRLEGDWEDSAVWDLIQRATEKGKVDGRFYWIREGEWGGERLVFLTDAQRAALTEAGWLDVIGLAEPVE